jgi:DUF4097 and DUF4098 domain-containing protein YvlB
VADHPPVAQRGSTIVLRVPEDDAERDAVIVSYRVHVPRGTEVRTVSDSGATTIIGVAGPVTVTTQSAAIELTHLGGTAKVTTGSGGVTIEDAMGAVAVTTRSSAVTGRSLRAGLRVRTGSGAIDAELSGTGDVDLETASSAIKIRGIDGGFIATTGSGQVTAEGLPRRPWRVSTGSGSITVALAPAAAVNLDATSRSSSVKVTGMSVQGSMTKGHAAGTIGGGGPLVRLTSGSGSIHVTGRSAEAD